MTDLTEKWKNGELINEEDAGCYYIETIDGEIYPDCLSPIDGFKNTYNYAVKKILAPVPSYAEWKELSHQNECLNSEYIAECNRADELEDSLQKSWRNEGKLKELLKECRGLMNMSKDWAYTSATETLITKIDEVLE